MKKLAYIPLAILLSINITSAQHRIDTAGYGSPLTRTGTSSNIISNTSHPLKTNDQWLPRWALDFNIRGGIITQDIKMVNLGRSYNRSVYGDPEYSKGIAIGGDAALNYFFSGDRRWGVNVGGMYMRYTGDVKMATFRADYKVADTFRQIIHSNGSVSEVQTTTNINIPVLLKYKRSFAGRRKKPGFGLNIEAGPVFGIYNTTTTSEINGSFSYEGIYPLIGGYDDSNPDGGMPGDPSRSFILTEAFYNSYHPGSTAAAQYIESFTKQGRNVGLNLPVGEAEPTIPYSEFSYGAIILAGVSYQLSYNVAILLNGYYMYQNWQNKGNETYRLTEKVISKPSGYSGNYSPLSNGVHESVYKSYGISAGVRIFFGESPDRDNDGVRDKDDECPRIWGLRNFKGCPDTDEDGVEDTDDNCPYEYGKISLKGCPDSDDDGFPDREDRCPYVAGTVDGCPDSDSDGVADQDDKCPSEPGLGSKDGCPPQELPVDTTPKKK